ncbi:MAG: undecaprenyl-diphosphate phosphatase [Terriglobia bacterium]
MTLLEAIVLAVVQGLTEFLPISSTAHLILVPWLAGWQDPGLTYDVALHAGTLVAVIAYFARDWWALFTDAFRRLATAVWSRKTEPALAMSFPKPPALSRQAQLNARLLQVLVVATLPAAFVGYFLESSAETVFRSPVLIAGMLIGVALLMGVADRRGRLVRKGGSIGFKDGLVIGLAQAVAIVPGTSRAGITIAAGLFRNLTRESAARFSFLLATPIIGGATLKKALEVWQQGFPAGSSAVDFAAGFAVSAVVGYAAIALLLRYLQVRTLKIFVAYRLVLGVIILGVEFLRSSA